MCVLGNNRNYTLAAEMFSNIPFQDYNAKLIISARKDAKKLKHIFENAGIGAFAIIVREADFAQVSQNDRFV